MVDASAPFKWLLCAPTLAQLMPLRGGGVHPIAYAPAVLEAMRSHPLGADASLIGEVIADAQHFVQMSTEFGGQRMVDWLSGEQLPRIC
jgi:hydrogenase maturation factor